MEPRSNMSQTEQSVRLPPKRDDGDTLEEQLTSNAYNQILPSRYLKKDENGEVVEDQEELFERVAKNVALAELAYVGRDIEIQSSWLRDDMDHDVEAGDVVTEENVNALRYDEVVTDLPDDVYDLLDHYARQFHSMMFGLGFMPNSPTLMNAGDELQQLSACFVDSPGDDMADIHDTAREASEVFQSGGGMGYAFWKLRPYGDTVGSTGGIASGPITFMNTYDQMCETVAQGGTRRGAQMGVMRVTHPDVIYFIHAKNKDVSLANALRLNDPKDRTNNSFGEALEEAREVMERERDSDGKLPNHYRNAIESHLSNFNISVGITDDFMEALENGEKFTFINPRTEEPHIATQHTKDMWSWFGLGDRVEVGEPLEIEAEIIWERIIDGAHENGEPGVIYLERANKKHSFDVDKHPEKRIYATNPCGEQPLMEYEACNLGHINLSTVAEEEPQQTRDYRKFTEASGNPVAEDEATLEQHVEAFLDQAIDWNTLDERIQYGTRFLENVVTMSEFPIEKITETVRNNRKIGLGIMGLAQLYVQLGIKYGSEEGNEVARQILTYINHESKSASHAIAKERGSFGDWDKSKYANPTEYPEWFRSQTGEDPEDWQDGYPIRNHNTTTIAPTGTTSMIGNTSGGCEPIHNVAYYKNVGQDVQGEEMLVEFDDYFLRVLEANDINVSEVKEEAKSQMANNEFDGVDGLTTVPDAIGEVFVVSDDLAANDHALVQCACQDGVDSAISKTVNAPHHATKDDTSEAFELVYEHGGKGITYYRDGTRSKQVITTRQDNMLTEEKDDKEILAEISEEVDIPVYTDDKMFVDGDSMDWDGDFPDADDSEFVEPKDRPKVLDGRTERVGTGYGTMYVNINFEEDGNPFEVFATISKSGGFTESLTEGLARSVSLALRAGVNPERVIDQLENIRAPDVAFDRGDRIKSIPDGIATALERAMDVEEEQEDNKSDTKKMIEAGESPECPDCGAPTEFSEGCKSCTACNWSKC